MPSKRELSEAEREQRDAAFNRAFPIDGESPKSFAELDAIANWRFYLDAGYLAALQAEAEQAPQQASEPLSAVIERKTAEIAQWPAWAKPYIPPDREAQAPHERERDSDLRVRIARAIAREMDEDFDRLEMGKEEMLRAADAALALAEHSTGEPDRPC